MISSRTQERRAFGKREIHQDQALPDATRSAETEFALKGVERAALDSPTT
jgi:hypothetical protein